MENIHYVTQPHMSLFTTTLTVVGDLFQ